MEFKKLKLSTILLDAIDKKGYVEATPIQELSIPVILEKKDVLGLAQTGTGKTAAFSLPIIDMLIRNYEADKKIKVLVLSPTRELAIQIRDNIVDYAKGTDFKCSVILGGVNQNSQKAVLKKGVDILVATPGRLLDLVNQGKANLSNVEMLVLDEADTMLDMGFIKDIKKIISKTPDKRQTLLFSATMSPEIKELSVKFMNNPISIKTNTEEVTADKIEQEVYFVDKNNKTNLLLDLIDTKEKPSVLIFTRTKHGANKLEEHLELYNVKTSVIHGNKKQSNRVKALGDFKNSKTRIMIATDIAARGIDIKDLNLVINYDIPEHPEVYVHRIGRTARAGKEGKAISICSSAELKDLKAIEKLIKMDINVIEHKYPMVLNEVKPKQGRSRKSEFSNKKSFNKKIRSSKNVEMTRTKKFSSKYANSDGESFSENKKRNFTKNGKSNSYSRKNNFKTNNENKSYRKSNRGR